ncbi:MAG TPA: nuclear transport factor 2 family protein [Pyrinomonadaceae bacterium]|nr:nuclear transport factor 2 family protein [Pyrinomonadaceae bacterium]
MKLCIFVIALVAILPGRILAGETEETNKALALRFYEQVWFSHNPSAVDELVAPTYFVHDIGERKNVTEPAERQKEIAEYFWQRGTMTGKMDFQIAEGDLVATRWQWDFEPSSWWMKALGGRRPLPIINVFRFKDGKIVEIWNHRHDIDGGLGNLLFVKGILVGLIPSVALLALIFVMRRRARKMRNEANTADVTA